MKKSLEENSIRSCLWSSLRNNLWSNYR